MSLIERIKNLLKKPALTPAPEPVPEAKPLKLKRQCKECGKTFT